MKYMVLYDGYILYDLCAKTLFDMTWLYDVLLMYDPWILWDLFGFY
jgi:hypothetical protein